MNFHQKEEELLTAIRHGNLERVRQLLSSGIALNTVLHSKERQDSATILGAAAYEGQVEVMRYLLECKVSIHYQEPCYSRNALHWACMGGQYDAAKFLLDHHIDVNCKDRDNVTPLIRATMFGRLDVVNLLVGCGADVNDFDRLHSSALHYATFRGKSDIVTSLIRAGCVQNTCAIFGQGTPLANLVYHCDMKNCQLLIDAGYRLTGDNWFVEIYKDKYHFNIGRIAEEDRDEDIGKYVSNEFHNVGCLAKVCRANIRKQLGGVGLADKIECLPLPKKLIQYLLLEYS